MWLETLGVFCFVFFITAIFWNAIIKKKKKNQKKIPGLKPTDPIEGNNAEIKKAKNNMGIFIWDLHKKFGPIVSFWRGTQYTVSVAAPEFLKPQKQLSNQIPGLFDQFRVLLGDDCFPLLDIEEVKRRRKIYDHHFMLNACKSYSECFLEIAQEYIDKWSKLKPDDQIPLMEVTSEAAIKGILRTNYGNYFKDESSLKHFQKLFTDVNKGIEDDIALNLPEGKQIEKKANEIKDIVSKLIDNRKQEKDSSDRNLFIDILSEDDITDSQRMSDSILFISAGYETTGKTLMWIIHSLATHSEVQEKVFKEVKSVLGDKPANLEMLSKLVYLKQVIEESIRLRTKPLFTSRITEEEINLLGYIIPKDTHILHAIGSLFHNPKYFPEPDKFDPDRFSPENRKGRDAYAFKPFGFAGKRQCPAQTYAMIKMTILLAEWCRRFRFRLAPQEAINIIWGFNLRPENEIWITVESRE